MKYIKTAICVLVLATFNLLVALLINRILLPADIVAIVTANGALIAAATVLHLFPSERSASKIPVIATAWVASACIALLAVLALVFPVSLRTAGIAAGIAVCVWTIATLIAAQVCIPNRTAPAAPARVIPPAVAQSSATGTADPFLAARRPKVG